MTRCAAYVVKPNWNVQLNCYLPWRAMGLQEVHLLLPVSFFSGATSYFQTLLHFVFNSNSEEKKRRKLLV